MILFKERLKELRVERKLSQADLAKELNATNCSPGFSTVGVSATINLTKDRYIVVENFVAVKMPVSINALSIFIGSTDVSVKSATSTDLAPDANGVAWNV